MAEPTAMEVEEEAGPPPKFSIHIHALMDANQSSHGLRHDDYKQYHAYCTRRLSRIRHAQSVKKDMLHSAQYVQGEKLRRHVYLSRKTHQPEVLYDERFLLVVFLGAERAWAHSNEIKAMASSGDQQQRLLALSEKSRSSPSKVRQHALRRLKRAVQLANELEEMAARSADERTILEAKAYGGWMRGNWSLEVGDWKTACEEFGSAVSICRTLSQTAEDTPENLELRDLFTARADNVLKPLLRYCQYELREAGGTVELQDTAPEQESSSGTTKGAISFRGRDIAVENKNLRVTLVKVEGLVGDVKNNPSDESKFLQLLSTYDDAITVVSADLQRYESMKSGPAVNAKRSEMSGLLGYIKFQKLHLLMGRNETMVNKLRQDVKVAGEMDYTPKRLEEIAHLYDALLQDARAVCTLPGGQDDIQQEDEFVLEANANVLRIRALRCYFVGRLYGTAHKHAEAVTLLNQAALLASRATEEIAACEDMAHANLYLEDLAELELLVRGAICRVQARAYAAKTSSGGDTQGSDRSLLERLHDFDAGSLANNHRLADVPPSVIPMPCKPTFFDVAWNHVAKFPLDELDRHMEQFKPQDGGSSGLLGWFRK